MNEPIKINSPFQLWKAVQKLLQCSDEELWLCCFGFRHLRRADPKRLRSYCIASAFAFSGTMGTSVGPRVFMATIAEDELDRRANPNDPDKEILFIEYAPSPDEDQEGWDEAEAARQKALSQERWDKQNKT